MSCRRTERRAKISMNVRPSSTTASSSVSTPWGGSPVNALPVSPSITLPASTIMNVGLSLHFVEQKESVKIPLGASAANAKEGSLLMPLG
ncbi:hypothetical protein LEMLEM_LOCUS7600 [Lemmus lemmus]